MGDGRRGAWFALVALCACNPEVRIGANEGVPTAAGTVSGTAAELGCTVPGDCTVVYESDVTVARPEDYAKVSGLTKLLRSVELEVRRLQARNAKTGEILPVREAQLTVNGQLLMTEADLPSLPKTVVLEEQTLAPMRQSMAAQQPVTAHVTARVVLSNPPPRLAVDYEVQPTLIFGP